MAAHVVLGLLGTTLDSGTRAQRWERWRPSVDVCRHPDLRIDRFELLHDPEHAALAEVVAADIVQVSPETRVVRHPVSFKDPWDFEEVYATLFAFARSYPFAPERERYLVHITTGSHVAQICWFLLSESRHVPAELLQASPRGAKQSGVGTFSIIDLDLGRYDRIARRHAEERADSISLLKAGIATESPLFNRMIAELEVAATRSREPILLGGPTGAGKSELARRIYALKRERQRVSGPLVEVNCATLRGDGAMSALFGHLKGAYTGATGDRKGLLREAHGGVLFLDEIGELGADEQAMLLRAIEDKRFMPVGSDRPVQSEFQLIAGTNRALRSEGFRADLLARIDLWTFSLPSLRERPEDLAPNLDVELERFAEREGRRVTMNREARARFLSFGRSPAALWLGNFRDLRAAVTRMATLAPAGRIDEPTAEAEIARLTAAWRITGADTDTDTGADTRALGDGLAGLLTPAQLAELDLFDRVQLAEVVRVCRSARSLSDAGRTLFAASRAHKQKPNDADRLRKYLGRFGLDLDRLKSDT